MLSRRYFAVILLLALSPPVLACEAEIPPEPRDYWQVIQATADMVRDRRAQALVRQQRLSLINLTWEDTGRFKNSAVGPNISDMTIQVQYMDPRAEKFRLTCMPVIRYPNFSDKTADVRIDKFFVLVGNESGRSLRRVSLREYLGNFRKYLSKPGSWNGRGTSLLAERDTHVLVSAQACFLPVPTGRKAEFNPVIFNYQSYKSKPAVLAILATREGTSATVIDNVRDGFAAGDTWGQRLFFNRNGQRAGLTGQRLSDLGPPIRKEGAAGGAARADEQAGVNMVMLIQVPLKQKRPRPIPLTEKALSAADYAPRRRSNVEAAVIGHGRIEGPFTEIDNLAIERDPKYPVRVTVQYYKATSNGVVNARDIAAIRAQIDRTYRDADYVGSLVVEGETGRPTEHDGPKYEPPDWWDDFWKRYEKNTSETRGQAIGRLLKLIGRERYILIRDDKILLEKKLRELNK
ncbi:MAG: hypothetical protein ABIF82_04490 [Planctomycetota bacterium]